MLEQAPKRAPKVAPPPAAAAPSAAPSAARPRGEGFDAQRASLRPGAAPGYEAQRAAAAPQVARPEDRARLTEVATQAVAQVAAEDQAAQGAIQHPMHERLGQKVGLALGIAVTRVLRFVPGWNDVIHDANGQEPAAIEGATRIGEHPLRKRHMEVVGPQIAAWAATLAPGRLHDFLAGVGEGASIAPGETYRREVAEAGG